MKQMLEEDFLGGKRKNRIDFQLTVQLVVFKVNPSNSSDQTNV